MTQNCHLGGLDVKTSCPYGDRVVCAEQLAKITIQELMRRVASETENVILVLSLHVYENDLNVHHAINDDMKTEVKNVSYPRIS